MDKQRLDSLLIDLRRNKTARSQVAVETLIPLLQSADSEIKLVTIHILAEIADKKALSPLIRIVQARRDARICCAAIGALGKIGGQQATDVVIAALEEIPLREHALWALSEMGGSQAVNILIEALRATLDGPGGEGRHELYAAQEGLRRMEKQTTLGPLIAALNHQNDSVRYNVADILGDIGDDSAIEPLKDALNREEDEWVRLIIGLALNKLEGDIAL